MYTPLALKRGSSLWHNNRVFKTVYCLSLLKSQCFSSGI